jgi:hypothetical protein
MRIPTKRIHRAFPELDRYSDEQCRLFVRRLRNKPGYVAAVAFGTAIVFVTSILLMCAGSGLVFAVLDESSLRPTIVRTLGRGVYDTLLPLCILMLGLGVPALATLGTRDFLYRRFLRRAIRVELERIRCLQCSYSLLGQTVADGRVRCPECGRPATLDELGLESADDLMVGDALSSARSTLP